MAIPGHEDEIIEMQALICQALSDPKRLRILSRLAEGCASVGDLAQILGVSMANASQHLSVLKSRGLVRSRREGTSVLYELSYPEITEACRILRGILSRQLADGNRLFAFIEGQTS